MQQQDNTEIWLKIPGHDGYEVSNTGRVRSTTRKCASKRWSGRSSFVKPGRILSQQNIRGRMRTCLSCDGRCVFVYVHRLVALAFLGPCPDGLEVCHNDGDATNNRPENLRYDTHASNMQDMVSHGRSNRGKRNPNAVITEEDAREIFYRYHTSSVIKKNLAKEFGISRRQINSIVSQKAWSWATEDIARALMAAPRGGDK